MRRHRLARLSKLTQGATLVSLGTLAACNNNADTKHVNAPEPTEPIHVNATAVPSTTASAEPTATATATTATATPSATAVASTNPTAKPTRPPTINAPPHVNAVNVPKN